MAVIIKISKVVGKENFYKIGMDREEAGCQESGHKRDKKA